MVQTPGDRSRPPRPGRASPSRVRAASLCVCGADACGACGVGGSGTPVLQWRRGSRAEREGMKGGILARALCALSSHYPALVAPLLRRWRWWLLLQWHSLLAAPLPPPFLSSALARSRLSCALPHPP